MVSAETQDLRKRAQEGYEDPVFFCKEFLPDLFPGRIPWVQRGLLAILTGRVAFLEKYGEVDKIISNFVLIKRRKNPLTGKIEEEIIGQIFYRDEEGLLRMRLAQHLLIVLPRGFSKTTLAGVAIPLYNTVYQEVPFTLYTSHAEDHAMMQLDNAKRQLEVNEKFLEIFGPLKPARTDVQHWSGRFYETVTGCAAAARGAGGQVRGLVHMGKRPSFVVADDLEDYDSVQSDAMRNRTKAWFMADLKPVLPKMDSRARIVVLATMIHTDCLAIALTQDPQWSVVWMGAYDRQGELVWPENLDARKLEAEKISYGALGRLSSFYMEYLSQEVAPEEQIFKPEWFRYGMPPGALRALAIAWDPALSVKRTADDTVMAVVGITDKGFMVVLDMWGMKTADEALKMSNYFRLIKQWNMLSFPSKYGIESTGYQASLVATTKEQMFREGVYFEIEPIQHKTKKEDRIKAMIQPRLSAGYLWFLQRFPQLEGQLMSFRMDGSHEHDDWPDAVAMAMSLLPDAAPLFAAIPPETDQMIDLEEEIGGSWQWAS